MRVLLPLLLVSCVYRAETAARIQAEVEGESAHRFADAITRRSRSMGANLLEVSASFDPDQTAAIVVVDGYELRVHEGQVGLVQWQRGCGDTDPQPQPVFSRTDGGVDVFVMRPQFERRSLRVAGRCSGGGCGTDIRHPRMVWWLPAASPSELRFHSELVPYQTVAISCDDPILAP